MGQYTGALPNEVTITVETSNYGAIDVVAGWDPNLDQYYFLHGSTDDTKEDLYLYHNLQDPSAPGPFSAATSGITYYQAVWRRLNLGPDLPSAFWREFAETRFSVPANPNTAHLMRRHPGQGEC